MERKKINFNLQFFAEGDTGANEGSETPSTTDGQQPTQQPSVDEVEKLKARIAELSTQEKKLKTQLREKMSDEEKEKVANQERQQEIEGYKSRLEDYELKEELLKDGVFTSEEANTIISNKKSNKDLISSMSTLLKTKIEQAKKEAIAEYMRSSNITSSTSTTTEDTEIDKIKAMASKYNRAKESKFF